jgi:hypothetical protein
MANWTATLLKAVKDPTGVNSNVVLAISFANSVTLETQTRNYISSNFSVSDLKTWAAGVITTLNQRDAALALAATAIQTGGASILLATG